MRPDLPALLGAAAGAALFLLIYGPATLDVTYDSWIFAGYINVDVLQHYAGWVAFRQSEWAFPLTFTTLLHWPMGGLASLADIIPLFALPLKVLSPLLPETFQYFGWFVLFSMAMGGWAGGKLLGLFGLSPLCRVLGSVFFAASPVLLERAFQHTALAAQWLVVLALYLYFKARRQGFEKFGWGFAPLCAAAVLTHAYFVPMVLAVVFAAAVDGLINARSPKPLAGLAAGLGATALGAFLLGYFTPSRYVPGGYGNLGFNLNAFWNPASFNWAIWDPSYQHLKWSRFLPVWPTRGDTLEGFAYLGLGVLAALAVGGIAFAVRLWKSKGALGHRPAFVPVAAPAAPKGAFSWLGRFALGHAGLLFSMLCLAVFAISNVVSANSRVLFTLPLPDALLRLADTFRSSGRMMWPVYHLLVLCAVLGAAFLFPRRRAVAASIGVIGGGDGPGRKTAEALAERLRRREARRAAIRTGKAAPLALCLMLALQGADLSGVLAEKHAYFAAPVVPQSYAAPENWERIGRRGRVLYQLELNEDRATALHAALAGMPSNFFLLARGGTAALQADINATREHLLEGRAPHGDAAYITSDPELAALLEDSLEGLFEPVAFGHYTAFVPVAD